MHDASPTRPKLLVSVRNAKEARDAVAGGCDILDVKEPANGSLGMADVAVISEIVTVGGGRVSRIQFCSDDVRNFERSDAKLNSGHPTPTRSRPPVSAALGETRDWRNRSAVPVLPPGLQYAKLGTAGLGGTADWESDWRAVRARFDAVVVEWTSVHAIDATIPQTADSRGLKSTLRRRAAADPPPQWVAVAYADWCRAAAPRPDQVLRAAIAGGCAGFLIDTCVKDGRSLFDAMPPAAIAELIGLAREANLFVALAGSLSRGNLETAAELLPDIIAVRSAACRDGRRDAPICREAVRRLRGILDSPRGQSAPLDEIRIVG